MTSPNGLGLELSGDDLTTDALLRALPEFASEPIGRFRGQRLDAAVFDQTPLQILRPVATPHK
jgi:hypothetical protein